MKIKLQVRTETEGTNFVIEGDDKRAIANVLTSFMDEDTVEVIIEKQHQSGTANVKDEC